MATALLFSIQECELLKLDALRDPAVLLLTSYMTFMTSSDTHLYKNYRKLVDICQTEVSNELHAIPAPESQH